MARTGTFQKYIYGPYVLPDAASRMHFSSSQTDPTRRISAESAPAISSRATCSSAWPAAARI